VPRATKVVNTKKSFSELYSKRLEEKQNKKLVLASDMMYSGDQFMSREGDARRHRR
jgi:hypothetical protein